MRGSSCGSSFDSTMESNRDESIRCLRLADKYLAEGNRERAERFAAKSYRLFPNQKAKGERNFLFINEV